VTSTPAHTLQRIPSTTIYPVAPLKMAGGKSVIADKLDQERPNTLCPSNLRMKNFCGSIC
jgi:hypothetical protein